MASLPPVRLPTSASWDEPVFASSTASPGAALATTPATATAAAPAASTLPPAAPPLRIADNFVGPHDPTEARAGLESRAFNAPLPGALDRVLGPDEFTVGPHETQAAEEGYQQAHAMGVGITPDYHFFDPKESQYEDQRKNISLEGQQEVKTDAAGHITQRPPIRWDDEGRAIAEGQRATEAQNSIMNAAVGGAAETPSVALAGPDGKTALVPGSELSIRAFYAKFPGATDGYFLGKTPNGLPKLTPEYEAKVQEALQHAQNAQSMRSQILLNRLGVKSPY